MEVQLAQKIEQGIHPEIRTGSRPRGRNRFLPLMASAVSSLLLTAEALINPSRTLSHDRETSNKHHILDGGLMVKNNQLDIMIVCARVGEEVNIDFRSSSRAVVRVGETEARLSYPSNFAIVFGRPSGHSSTEFYGHGNRRSNLSVTVEDETAAQAIEQSIFQPGIVIDSFQNPTEELILTEIAAACNS